AGNDGLYPSGYYLFRAEPPAAVRAALQAPAETKSEPKSDSRGASYWNRLWKGWVLPASDADTWFVRGSENYYRDLRSVDLEKAMEATRARYRRLKLEPVNAATHF